MLIQVALNQHRRHIFCIILHTEQIVGEPPVHDILVKFPVHPDSEPLVRHGRRHMITLMQDQLHGLSRLPEGTQHHLELFGGNIFIMQPVDDEGGAVQPVGVQRVIPVFPERAVVRAGFQLLHTQGVMERIHPGALLLRQVVAVPAAAVVGKEAVQHLLRPVALGALLILLTVPVCNTGYRNDGPKAFCPCRSHRERHRPRIGPPRHAHIAIAPVRPDRCRPRPVRESLPVTVKPLHHSTEGVPLIVGTYELQPVGTLGAESGTDHHRKSPDQIIVEIIDVLVNHVSAVAPVRVIPAGRVCGQCRLHGGDLCGSFPGRRRMIQIPGQIEIRIISRRRHLHMIISVRIDSGAVRPGFENHRRLVVPHHSTPGHLHECFDQIPLPVSVHVVIRLHIDAETHNHRCFRVIRRSGLPICKRKDRHRPAVFENRLFTKLPHGSLLYFLFLFSFTDSIRLLRTPGPGPPDIRTPAPPK